MSSSPPEKRPKTSLHRVASASLLLLGGLGALAMLWGELLAYDEFQPLRGYSPLHAHIMAPQEGFFLGLFSVLGTVAAICLGFAAFLLQSRRSPADLLNRFLATSSDRLWLVLLSGLALAASLVVGFVVLEQSFLTDDEQAMLFQARLLTEGRLFAQPTPFPGAFRYAMIVGTPRWYGIYPLGHPSIMALSLLLTSNPRILLALVATTWIGLTFLLARKLYDRGTALLATSLLCLSPFFVLSSGSMAAELTSGLFLLLALNLAVRIDGSRPRLTALALGLSLGLAYLARPYTALAIGGPTVCWVAYLWFRRRTDGLVPLFVLMTALPCIVAYLAINSQLTGSPWITPYQVNFPEQFRIGFGQDAFGIIHTPQLAFAVSGLTLLELNAWTLGWPLSLLPICLALILGRRDPKLWALLTLPIMMLLAYIPVPMAGVHDTGPLYYLEVLPVLVIIAARGLVLAARWSEPMFDGRGRALVVWLSLAALVVGAAFWSLQIHTLRSLSEFNRAPYEIAERVIDGQAVVFIDEIQTDPPSSWVLGIRPPRPDLSDRLVYGKVVPPEKATEILRWMENRRGYYLTRDPTRGAVSLLPLPSPDPGKTR